jgi:hypothetical protein
MSAGHSLRRQNYNFVTLAPVVTPQSDARGTSWAAHSTRIFVAIVLAIVLDLATFATITSLAGR